METDANTASASTSGLEYVIAEACKDSYTLREINNIFTINGAEMGWWCEPSTGETSARMIRVFGWFEGIRANAPAGIVGIVRGVGDHMLVDLAVQKRPKGLIRAALEKLDGVDRANRQLDRFNLHPEVHKASAQLFNGGHYRMAILQTYVALITAVKEKSGLTGIDGTPLMQKVFSPNSPVLHCSDDKDERQGFMYLFTGAVMAIRNPRAHNVGEEEDVDQTLEWLALASALFRVLDRATLVNDDSKTP